MHVRVVCTCTHLLGVAIAAVVTAALGPAAAVGQHGVLCGGRVGAAECILPLQRLHHAEAVQRQLCNLDLWGRV